MFKTLSCRELCLRFFLNLIVHFLLNFEKTNYIYKKINERDLTKATYIDMAKAFDTVNHEILLNKLHKLGLIENILKLLKIT